MNNLITFSDRLSKFLMVVAAAWAFGLTFLIMLNIIDRELFDGVAEIVTASIVIIVFLQAGYAIRSRSMLRADFLVKRFSPQLQKLLLGFGYILGAVFFLPLPLPLSLQEAFLGFCRPGLLFLDLGEPGCGESIVGV